MPSPEKGLHRTGRPSTLTATRVSRILQEVAIGTPQSVSAGVAGVPKMTLASWKQRGEVALEAMRAQDPDIEVTVLAWIEEHSDPGDLDTYSADSRMWIEPPPAWARPERWPEVLLFVLLSHARDRAEAASIRHIQRAARDDWRAAAWFLERTRPDQYGRQERISHQGVEGGVPIGLQAVPSTDDLMDRIEQLRNEKAAREAQREVER